jgi:hypothetical protein
MQNLDTLYFKAAGEPQAHVEAVRISEDAICVFNATPLEKYERYRLYLERWRCERGNVLDLSPMFYNLIDALLRFFGIDKYQTRTGTAIVDSLPEVCSRTSPDALRKILLRKRVSSAEMTLALDELRDYGSCYLARLNAIFAARLEMRHSSQIAAQFVHLACRGQIGNRDGQSHAPANDNFYRSVLEQAVVYIGSQVLYPARSPVHESDYYALYSHPPEAVECRGLYTYREYLEMLDFLILHKEYERDHHAYSQRTRVIEDAIQFKGARREFVTRELGLMLGSALYETYLSGRISRRALRSLFLHDLSQPETAHNLYFELARKCGKPQRVLLT